MRVSLTVLQSHAAMVALLISGATACGPRGELDDLGVAKQAVEASAPEGPFRLSAEQAIGGEPVLENGYGSIGRRSTAVLDNQFLVAWTKGGIFGTRIASNGQKLDPTGFEISPAEAFGKPKSAGGMENYLVTWTDPSFNLHMQRVD